MEILLISGELLKRMWLFRWWDKEGLMEIIIPFLA
jgi:hypothetical protein